MSLPLKALCEECKVERREFGFKDGYDEGTFARNIHAWDCLNLGVACGICDRCLLKVRGK